MATAQVELLRPYVADARAELARRHLADFCGLMDPGYQPAAHTRLLCEHLEALERGDLDRLAVFMPPRHSKTYHVSERFPAWYLGRNPDRQVILASYGAELAEGNSRRARNLFEHPRWPFAAKLAGDSHAVNRWHTSAGGVVVAAGVGGALTGFGADLLLIDDPVKGREDADSELQRERAWQWYIEVARTRLMPGGRIGLCQTRWHEDDLAGRILNGAGAAGWTVLNLPALADDNDPLGRVLGAPLWPAWFSRDSLLALQTELGSRAWSALYQQAPTAAEGGMFKRGWMAQRYSEPPKLLGLVLAVDSAFKTGVMNDYSAIAAWGVTPTGYYLIDAWRDRVEFHDLKRIVVASAEVHKPAAVLIEDTAAGQSVIQELKRETRLPIVPIKVTAPKETRAAAVSPLFEAGKIHLPASAPWLDDWIEEHVAFPTGRHDDWVDTTSMALARLRMHAFTPPQQTEVEFTIGAQPGERRGGNLIEEYLRARRAKQAEEEMARG